MQSTGSIFSIHATMWPMLSIRSKQLKLQVESHFHSLQGGRTQLLIKMFLFQNLERHGNLYHFCSFQIFLAKIGKRLNDFHSE